jgi:hypothetical protein
LHAWITLRPGRSRLLATRRKQQRRADHDKKSLHFYNLPANHKSLRQNVFWSNGKPPGLDTGRFLLPLPAGDPVLKLWRQSTTASIVPDRRSLTHYCGGDQVAARYLISLLGPLPLTGNRSPATLD